ncbi:MAG: hypothetical protein M1825_005796 [Sarcosagium campestre]|nr:MAG: hypothetical protein M1825_005796 [Sarcosagium campestre]
MRCSKPTDCDRPDGTYGERTASSSTIPEKDNPFVAFRRFADAGFNSIFHSIFSIPSTLKGPPFQGRRAPRDISHIDDYESGPNRCPFPIARELRREGSDAGDDYDDIPQQLDRWYGDLLEQVGSSRSFLDLDDPTDTFDDNEFPFDQFPMKSTALSSSSTYAPIRLDREFQGTVGAPPFSQAFMDLLSTQADDGLPWWPVSQRELEDTIHLTELQDLFGLSSEMTRDMDPDTELDFYENIHRTPHQMKSSVAAALLDALNESDPTKAVAQRYSSTQMHHETTKPTLLDETTPEISSTSSTTTSRAERTNGSILTHVSIRKTFSDGRVERVEIEHEHPSAEVSSLEGKIEALRAKEPPSPPASNVHSKAPIQESGRGKTGWFWSS